MNLRLSVFYTSLATLLSVGVPIGASAAGWHAVQLPSRPMNIAANDGTLWVCGADELIASSTDGGNTWSTLHLEKNGGVLLTIEFANHQLGYTAGTESALLVTNDGGRTWGRVPVPAPVIYDVSFSDEKHGLVHASRAIYSTADGGATWNAVKIDLGNDKLRGFPHVSEVLALDAKREAIVLSEGNAAYFHQKLLLTNDGGLTWEVVDVPSTGLARLTKRGGKYWFAGMEVIEKDKPGGGYGVPLLMHSLDGLDWVRVPRWSQKEFSVCNVQGCLYWDGAGVELPPASPAHFWTFPAEKVVTAKWAVAKDSICSVSIHMTCAPVATTQTMPPYLDSSSPIQDRVFPPALDAPQGQGLQCISCDVERVIVTPDYQGVVEIELRLHIAQNGLVEKAEVVHATEPKIGKKIAAAAGAWIYVPYETNGVVRAAIADVKLRVQAIKSK